MRLFVGFGPDAVSFGFPWIVTGLGDLVGPTPDVNSIGLSTWMLFCHLCWNVVGHRMRDGVGFEWTGIERREIVVICAVRGVKYFLASVILI